LIRLQKLLCNSRGSFLRGIRGIRRIRGRGGKKFLFVLLFLLFLPFLFLTSLPPPDTTLTFKEAMNGP